MTAPAATPTVRMTEAACYVYGPVIDADRHTRHRGPCWAYARRRVADRRWEVRDLRTRQTSTVDTFEQATGQLSHLTGVSIP